MKVALSTGGGDKPYAIGLLQALIAKGVEVDFIGSNEFSPTEVLIDHRVTFLNLRGDTNPAVPPIQKVIRIARYYLRLILYAAGSDSVVFHILWANKVFFLDRILLNLYYKLLGKQLVFTAHNIHERERGGSDSLYTTLTLKALYALMDHIFVHTQIMKQQLIDEFGVEQSKVSVIPFGINNTLPKSDLTPIKARSMLQLDKSSKVLLFFGRIVPYKGLDYAIGALNQLVKMDDRFVLIIAGRIEKGCQGYWKTIENNIEQHGLGQHVIKRIGFIPDDEVEVFFKSADVSLLPYKSIFQSGVLFLSYGFGLPVIGTDVGSFNEDIVEGRTGFVCKADDVNDLTAKIRTYFSGDLFANLQTARADIMSYGNKKYSWDEVGESTSKVYETLSENRSLIEDGDTGTRI